MIPVHRRAPEIFLKRSVWLWLQTAEGPGMVRVLRVSPPKGLQVESLLMSNFTEGLKQRRVQRVDSASREGLAGGSRSLGWSREGLSCLGIPVLQSFSFLDAMRLAPLGQHI